MAAVESKGNNPKVQFVPLLGSEHPPIPGAHVSGKLDPAQKVRVTIVVRPKSPRSAREIEKQFGDPLPKFRRYLSRQELGETYGASSEDLALVQQFAKSNSLAVVEVSAPRRTVVLEGTVGQVSRAFNVNLDRYEHPKGSYRGLTGPIYVPASLSRIVEAVLGLDDRPQARPNFRLKKKRRAVAGISFTPPQVAELYDYPTRLDGTGQTVGIIELGGGYKTEDIRAYFAGLNMTPPTVVALQVDGSGNSPSGDPSGPDGEVMLDIEVIGAIAPKAQIVVYFAPNTDAGFVDAITSAVHDKQHNPSVISISWGSPEASWSQQGVQAMEQAFADAAMVGVTVCAASGDQGSSDGLQDGLAHVDYPASSQYVTGCGGTTIQVSGTTIQSEAVWNELATGGGASGGGVSDLFALPSWQTKANVPPSVNPGAKRGRGVPDVSGDSDPRTGYEVRVDGEALTLGGTSAVAPLWSGLLALVNQKISKPLGYLNPLLYGSVVNGGGLRDVTAGNNGSYSAAQGWDACTGLGSPDGAKMLNSLSAAATGA